MTNTRQALNVTGKGAIVVNGTPMRQGSSMRLTDNARLSIGGEALRFNYPKSPKRTPFAEINSPKTPERTRALNVYLQKNVLCFVYQLKLVVFNMFDVSFWCSEAMCVKINNS